MADVAVTLVRQAGAACARLPVVLTGGCFQNARLVEGVLARLGGEREVVRHRLVPPGDGGIALGQALVADRGDGMMGGPLPFTGRLVALRDEACGRTGRVSVRGAQVEVALDLVPAAQAGDSVLVQAGVALAIVREED